MSLAAAVRSESVKQVTTSMWWLLAIILVVYVAFTAAALGFVFAASASGALPGQQMTIDPSILPPTIYSSATSVGYVFPLLIGTLMVTSEFRHQTLTPTFLAFPRRGTALAGKVVVGVLLGLLYGVLGTLAAVGAGAGFLSGFGIDTGLGEADTWALIGRMLIAFVLWVLIGIGVGALVRNQVGAVVGVLVFTQFLEPIGRVAGSFVDGLSDVVRFLPGAAGDALVGASVFTGIGPTGGDGGTLEWWVGGLVLLAYAAVFFLVGWATTWRRDVS